MNTTIIGGIVPFFFIRVIEVILKILGSAPWMKEK